MSKKKKKGPEVQNIGLVDLFALRLLVEFEFWMCPVGLGVKEALLPLRNTSTVALRLKSCSACHMINKEMPH